VPFQNSASIDDVCLAGDDGQAIATTPTPTLDGQSFLFNKQCQATLQSAARRLNLQHTADMLDRDSLGKSSNRS